ncbi:MAG: hypothetical protein ACRDOD_06785 [Streptosporangiaceae bacterium]
MSDPVAVSESRHVEIVPYLVTPDNQVTLDPQHLIWRRHPEQVSGRQRHLRDLQRPVPDELTDPRLDIAQDDLSRRNPVGHPSVRGLDRFEHRIEAGAEILQHMIVVKGGAMVGPQCRGGVAYQNGIGHDLLQPRRRFEHPDQLGPGQSRGVRPRSGHPCHLRRSPVLYQM